MAYQLKVHHSSTTHFENGFSDAFYHVFLSEGNGKVWIDEAEYQYSDKTAIFTSPYQHIRFSDSKKGDLHMLDFHGDFYCIEYHKKEVACNGLLFNNIYLRPHVPLDGDSFNELKEIFEKIENIKSSESFSEAVARSYLQLILAISSREKSKILENENLESSSFEELKNFQNLVEEHFISERTPAFYADLLHISPNTLSKKIKAEYHKTPSQIIQERVILEAKKLIHLTRKPIKEIASELNFEDEYYFSKYFKKHTSVSPTQFREEVGISVVADL